MLQPDRDDWSEGTAPEHLGRMRDAPAMRRCAMARDYDWGRYPEPVLGWVMAQKTVGLGTALAVFFKGRPERFNYLHKRNVPDEFCGATRLLDNICLRINSGFYLVMRHDDVADAQRVRKWLADQQLDRSAGCSGRWVLDEVIVGRLLNGAPLPQAHPRPRASAPRLFSLDAWLPHTP